MTTRDFSDGALNGIIAKYHSSIMEGQFDSEVSDDFYEYYGFRYSGRDDSNEAASKKQEYYDTMVNALKGIFNSARQYDTDIGPSFQPLQEGIENISGVIASLSGSISRNSPHLGLWRIPTEDFAANLAANDDALFAAARNRFAMLDENGNLVYDWDEIEMVLDKPADEITPLEYYILAYLYSQMGEEDLEKFLQRLADPGNGYRRSQLDLVSPTNPTWVFDQAKLDELSKYLILSYVARDLDVDANTLTRLAILRALPGLGGPQSAALPAFGITGEVGAEYPPIDITLNPDGSATIDYSYVCSSNTHSVAGLTHFTMPGTMTFQPPEEESLDLFGKWMDIIRTKRDEHNGLDAGDALNAANAIASAGLAWVSIPPPFGGIIGIGLAILSIGLLLSDKVENTRFNDEMKGYENKSKGLANVGTRFGCGAVITTTVESGTRYNAVLLPGPSTYEIIDKVNEKTASYPEVTGTLKHPLEFGAISKDPEAASDFLDDFRDNHPEDYEAVFGKQQD